MGQFLSIICSSICGEGVIEKEEGLLQQQKSLISSPGGSPVSDDDESNANTTTYALWKNLPSLTSSSPPTPMWKRCSSCSLIHPTCQPCPVTDSNSGASALLFQNLPIPSPNLEHCADLFSSQDVISVCYVSFRELNSSEEEYESQVFPYQIQESTKERTAAQAQIGGKEREVSQLQESKRKVRQRQWKKTQLIKEDAKLKKQTVAKEVWVKHYSNRQNILLVGEGDFSFSASLALAFGSAVNMVATSLNSIDFLSKNYRNALDNIKKLKDSGCTVIHGVDATKMMKRGSFKRKAFDRIIFNFPHAGFSNLKEPQETQISQHQLLVSLFLRNAKKLIGQGGEIHISHKSNGFHNSWNLEGLASGVGLRLIGKVRFNLADYPGYNTKYGYGGDGNFNCNPSLTFKFGQQVQFKECMS